MALRSWSSSLAGRRPHDHRPRSHTKRSHGHARSRIERPGSNFQITFARAQVSRHLGHRFLSYLTPEEAHQRIDAVEQDRNRLFLRLFWGMSARVSETIVINLGDVNGAGIRVLRKGAVERVVFVQDILVGAILFYARERDSRQNGWVSCGSI